MSSRRVAALDGPRRAYVGTYGFSGEGGGVPRRIHPLPLRHRLLPRSRYPWTVCPRMPGTHTPASARRLASTGRRIESGTTPRNGCSISWASRRCHGGICNIRYRLPRRHRPPPPPLRRQWKTWHAWYPLEFPYAHAYVPQREYLSTRPPGHNARRGALCVILVGEVHLLRHPSTKRAT